MGAINADLDNYKNAKDYDKLTTEITNPSTRNGIKCDAWRNYMASGQKMGNRQSNLYYQFITDLM